MTPKRIGQAAVSALVLSAAAACSTPPLGGNPNVPPPVKRMDMVNDCSSLVKIRGKTTAAGIAEQDAWIAARYPGARKLRQAVTECGATPVDRITFERNGVEKTVLFDISSFFGKVGKDDLDDLLAG